VKEFDFSMFTDRQLGALARQLTAEFVQRREAVKRLVKRRGGFVEGGGPKYVNSDNPAQTWSGRGKRPSWLDAALDEGHDPDRLALSDDHPVRRG
jgi:DNA-binding protein H-NS